MSTATTGEGTGHGSVDRVRVTVDPIEIESGAVVTSKLHDLAVTTAKIDDLAVTTAKINAAAVTTAKLASGAVTGAKLNLGSLEVFQAAGRNGSGAISTSGTAVGDRVIAVLCTTGNTASASLFESTVTVVNEIQQSSASDLSSSRFIFLTLPAAS